MALRAPVLVRRGQMRAGTTRTPRSRSEVRTLEDQQLLYKVAGGEDQESSRSRRRSRSRRYFEKDPTRFASAAVLKVDQIWCETRAARKVKKLLDEGADFEAVQERPVPARTKRVPGCLPPGEGLFWADLWKAEPNHRCRSREGLLRQRRQVADREGPGEDAGQGPAYSEQLGQQRQVRR